MTARRSLGRPFNLACSASIASATGTGMHFAAFPVLAAQVADSPWQLSLVTSAGTLPWLLLSLPAGVLVDRLDPKRIMIAADVLCAVAVAVLIAVLSTGEPGLGLIICVAAVLGVGEVFSDCASLALLPALVDPSELEPANGRLYAGTTAGRDFAGQLLGGLLYAFSKLVPFAVNALSFCVSAVLMSRVRLRRPPEPAAPRTGFFREMADGVRIVLRSPLLLSLAMVSAIVNAIFLGELTILVLYATEKLDVAGQYYGVLLTALAAGSVLGGLAATPLIRATGRSHALPLALAVIGACSLVLGTVFDLVTAMAAFAAMGAAMTLWNVAAVSTRQRIVPQELLGRANSVYRLLAWGAMPLGGLAFGAVATAYGLGAPFTCGGLVTLLAALALLPVIRKSLHLFPSEESVGP